MATDRMWSEDAAMSLRAGLIGDPVGHSISPVFQQAAFDALGIDARYEAWRIPLADLTERVASLRAADMLGANVTVPHKQHVIPLLDELDDAARAAGAVNTIVNRNGRLRGYNTDTTGFIDALQRDLGFDPAGQRVAVLGAGGSARAIVWTLVHAGAANVLVLNRTLERAQELVAEVAPSRGTAGPLPDDGALEPDTLADRALIVNCTPLGMRNSPRELDAPVVAAAIPEGSAVMDIVANPMETPLMRAALTRGCRVLGGLSMLVRQGAGSFQYWTGRPAPLDVMFAAARAAMAERG